MSAPLLPALWRRVSALLLRGLVTAVLREANGLQRLTLTGPGGQPRTDLRHWLPYGIDVVLLPPDGSEGPEALALTLASGHRIVLPCPDSRFAASAGPMEPGDMAIYAASGARVICRQTGDLELTAPRDLLLSAPNGAVRILAREVTADQAPS